jgi:peptidyl-prolyl cis-trans isomerase C
LAEQCEALSKDTALKALKYLKQGTTIYEYCAPCGDTNRKLITIETIWVIQEKEYAEIYINGNPIDLAYTYITSLSGRNLAGIVDCPTKGVPEYIPIEPIPSYYPQGPAPTPEKPAKLSLPEENELSQVEETVSQNINDSAIAPEVGEEYAMDNKGKEPSIKYNKQKQQNYLFKVNDSKMTKDDYIRELKSLPEYAEKLFDGPGGKIKFLDELIKKELLYQEALKQGIDKEDGYKKKLDDFKKITLISEFLERKIESKVMVTEEEAKSYYEKHKEELTSVSQIKASHILVKTEDEATMIYAQINNGEDFASIAKKSSIDSDSANNGGDLGYFSASQMDTEFEQAAIKLNPGEISKPVKTKFGYHIIKVTDKKLGPPAEFDSIREALQKRIVAEKQSKAFDTYVSELRKDAQIAIDKEALYAKINNKEITRSDIERELKSLPEFAQKQFEGPGGKIKFLDELVKKDLIYQEALKNKLDSDNAYIQKVKDYQKIGLISILIDRELNQGDEESKKSYFDAYIKGLSNKYPVEINQDTLSDLLLMAAQEQDSKSASPASSVKIIVPDLVRETWTCATIIIEDKTARSKQEYVARLNSFFIIPQSHLIVRVGEFLPDFKLDGFNLTSGSNEPLNPALSVQIFEYGNQIFPASEKKWGWLFAKVPSLYAFQHERYAITLKEGIRRK